MRLALPIGFFSRCALTGFAAMFALHLQLAPSRAQGSTGGSIGKQDKSVSGDQDGRVSKSKPSSKPKPRSERSSGSERASRSERSSSKSRSSGSGGGGGNFDGTWASASFGRTCSDRTTDVVTISGGRMSGTGFSGRVSSSGSVSGTWSGSGLSASVSGRMSGSRGSGSFRRSDGCVGGWTLSRQ